MPVIRITIPDDDEVTNGFFAHQGPRSRSIAVRMLAQLFVSEYGYTDVMNVIGKRLVEPGANGHSTSASAAGAQPQVADDDAVDTVVEDTEDAEGTAPDEQPASKKPAKKKKKASQKPQPQPTDKGTENDSDTESAPAASAPTPIEMDDLFNSNRNR